MKKWNKLAGVMALAIGLTSFSSITSASTSASAPAATKEIELKKIAGYSTGAGLAEAGAEIVTYDTENKKVYLINGATSSIEIVDISQLESGVEDQLLTVADEQKISIAERSPVDQPNLFGDVTSVVVHPTEDLVAAAVPNSVKTEPGSVVFFTKSGEYVDHVEVGALPDMITITPDGSKFLIANEGEPNSDYTVDPDGSVSIIEIAGNAGEYEFTVTTAAFDDESIIIDKNVRYASLLTGYVENPTPAQWAADLEPEFITVSEDGEKAYVALQENNAIAVLDIETKKFTHVYGLGFKNYMLPENALDPSDRDPEDDPQINIKSGYPVLGVYMPDGMALKTINGKTYLFTANEGDGRAYGPDEEITDEIRFKDVVKKNGPAENTVVELDASYYPGTTQEELDAIVLTELRTDDKLGRLKVINTMNDAVYKDEAGVTHFNALYTYGARSFSIWDVENLGTANQLTFDSQDDFEQIVAALLPDLFNSNHEENAKDDRSDDKGPEPEYVEIGEVDGQTYAFIGLERQSALMVYNVSNPEEPQFVSFVNMRDVNESEKGDLGPEGLKFIAAEDSPTGKPLLLTGNEVSGTLAIFEISSPPFFNVEAEEREDVYTVSQPAGITTMTVNAGISGLKTFGASITPGKGHDGLETVIFKHSRGGVQLGLNAIRADFDAALTAEAQFNVQAGDVVEVYVVDKLSNEPSEQPIVLQ